MNQISIINNYGNINENLDDLNKYLEFASSKLKLKNAIFNVIIITDEDIHKINKEYRKIDRPTDVISFALEDDKQIDIPEVRVLGDIYISYDKVISQAKEYGHDTKRELYFLATHGLLHLLGYNHEEKEEEKIMFDKQKEILDKYGIKR